MNKNKQKTIVIVLDGLDHEYIQRHADSLPYFGQLIKQERLAVLESVVPADSIPAWTTLYTGRNPAEHGFLESIDYLNDKGSVKTDTSTIRTRTLWDRIGETGKKVFVFNPFMAYPAWDVNGLMITGPVFEGGQISTNRPEMVNLSEIPPIGGIVDHPSDKQMEQFYKNNMELSQRQFDAFHTYFQRERYDFAFLGITTPDRMQHFLWRYTDPADRTHPKHGRLKTSILEMYQLMEANVQRIMERYGDEYNVIVLSDHGHGRRCEKTFYINQWLINQGLIEDKSRKKRSIEYLKNATFYFLAKHHIVAAGTRFFKRFRFAHKVKNADYLFKEEKAVYAPRFDGCNPFGGVNVSRAFFSSEEEYEQTRQRIIDGLLQVQDHGQPIMLWAKRREDIYSGEMVQNYPSIVYLLKPEYGVDRSLFGKRLFGISPMHEVVSGGHRFHGVIMGNRDDVQDVGSILNMYQYILSITIGH